MRQVKDILERAWTHFVECVPDARDPDSKIYKNSRYQVHIRRIKVAHYPDMLHLSFKRLDKGTFIPYRDKMRIKDELISPEHEAVELYPARSREVDTTNQYHLWLIDDQRYRFPFGFTERLVSEGSSDGSVQAPFDERPADCLDVAALEKLRKERLGW